MPLVINNRPLASQAWLGQSDRGGGDRGYSSEEERAQGEHCSLRGTWCLSRFYTHRTSYITGTSVSEGMDVLDYLPESLKSSFLNGQRRNHDGIEICWFICQRRRKPRQVRYVMSLSSCLADSRIAPHVHRNAPGSFAMHIGYR